MIFVGRESQWYITQRVVITTRPLARCWKPLLKLIHLYLFSQSCAFNIRHISIDKMIFVGLERQWYITQRVIFTKRKIENSSKAKAVRKQSVNCTNAY